MELQIVNFEQAKRLKEIGFDWKTIHGYRDNKIISKKPFLFSENNSQNYNKSSFWGDDHFSAPTVSLALKWFRNVMEIPCYINIYSRYENAGYYYHNESWERTYENYKTYELAESALLDELLTLIEKKNENK